MVEPQGYRTSLALQLHAAAVLTDSGGVQREAAWLGVPCLVLRDTTEWVEAVAGSEGRMVVVGLDAGSGPSTRSRRWRPADRAGDLARGCGPPPSTSDPRAPPRRSSPRSTVPDDGVPRR